MLLPKDQCFICSKRVKKHKQYYDPLMKLTSKSREYDIKEKAELIQDPKILCLIDLDLVAKEAKYHKSCYEAYMPPEKGSTSFASSDEAVKENYAAHEAAFQHVCEYIQKQIIEGCNVERITMLRERYLQYLKNNYTKYYNPGYKTSKLKAKLIKHFDQSIKFWQPNYHSELVYSSNIGQGKTVEAAFEAAASDSRILEEAALILRRQVLDHAKSFQLPWPPPPGHALREQTPPPQLLMHFMQSVLSGEKHASDQKQRVAAPLSHDIMYAITNGHWMTSKHIMLGVSLWHLTGQAEVITLLNRFGHCVSYTKVLEIITAVYLRVKEHTGPLPPHIVTHNNQVVHFCFDNFDLTEETPSGRGTTHSTHGLILQEKYILQDMEESSYENGNLPKTKARSAPYEQKDLHPCYVKNKPEPPKTSIPLYINSEVNIAALESDAVWILCRKTSNVPLQTVPRWKGWVSCTGTRGVEPLTTIEYLQPINAPITENSTVYECLTQAQAMSKAVHQTWTIITFDLAAAMKAYKIVWQYEETFQKIFIQLGVFHTICAYFGTIFKYMEGSGLEQIIIEANLCASGSITKVLEGKHYNRILYVLETLLEALERLLIEEFENSWGTIPNSTATVLQELASDLTHENLKKRLKNDGVNSLLNKLDEFKKEIRDGHHGKTAQYWIMFMDKVKVALQFLRATKENNLDLHIAMLEKMCVAFFNQDRINYARYG